MSRANRGEGSRAVTVKATAAPNAVTPIGSPCRLLGWSLAAGLSSSQYAEGTVTSPGALATIATLGTVPAGEYTLSWQVSLDGTGGAGDRDNMQLVVGGVVTAVALYPANSGLYQQAYVSLVIPAGGAAVLVQSIVAGSAGAIYGAQLSLSSGTGMEVTIADSGQILGKSYAAQGNSDTQILTNDGVYVSTNITLTVAAGTVSGVLYICDGTDPHYD